MPNENAEKALFIPKTEQKTQEFSLLSALRRHEKSVLEINVACFLGRSEYEKIRMTCTDLHGPIDIDRRQRFNYSKKVFNTITRPFWAIIEKMHSYTVAINDDMSPGNLFPDCGKCAALLIVCPPSYTAATLASGCTFLGCWVMDEKNSSAYKARDMEIKNLPPGISMDVFDKPKDPPNHQEMDEAHYSPRLR